MTTIDDIVPICFWHKVSAAELKAGIVSQGYVKCRYCNGFPERGKELCCKMYEKHCSLYTRAVTQSDQGVAQLQRYHD